MKYKRFRWLLTAMTLALAGIVCLQVYWLDKAAKAERRKYEDRVRGAMAEATFRLESGEAYSLLSDAFLPGDSSATMINDSVIVNNGRHDIRIFRKAGPGVLPPPGMPPDTIAVTVYPPAPPLPPEPPLIGPGEMRLLDSARTVLVRTQRLKTAVKDVWKQYIARNGKASERVTVAQIHGALGESFRNAAISDSFHFGVYDAPSRRFELLSDTAKTGSLLSGGYRVPLFPSDIRPGGEQLVVRMEGDSGRLFHALWPQLLAAILLTGVLVLVFFLTFREALRQKKLSEIRSDFINNMTHEFKTPIATISLAADTMVNPAVIGDSEKVRHYAGVIRRENRRMNDQVEKVLELALAERNELRLTREPLDLRALILHAVQVMSLQATARNGTIRTELAETLPAIPGDAFHLERAIVNLLDNAMKYTTAAPEILVRAFMRNNAVQIEVSDNGIGIPDEERTRIFDRFYRVSTGNRHDVKGFGLGLSYVKTIVEKHGGTIVADGRPGKGSTFTIRIPV